MTVVVNRSAVDRIASVKSISPCSIRTCAHRDVPPGRTHSGRSALLSGARVLASEIDARLVIRALAVGETLSSLTTAQRVANVTGRTGAHRPLLPGAVVARSADRVRAAWIRLAQIACFEQSTADERIAGHVPRAATDRSYVAQIAVRVDAAYSGAGVHAFLVKAGRFVAWTFGMRGALRTASDERIPQPIVRASAFRHMIDNTTFGVGCAIARALAFEVRRTGKMIGTLVVALAFVAAAGQG